MLTPEITYTALLAALALHLLHHRLARRHISFAEVISAFVLCVPLTALPAALLISVHGVLIAIQVVGSLWITRLSPDWSTTAARGRALG